MLKITLGGKVLTLLLAENYASNLEYDDKEIFLKRRYTRYSKGVTAYLNWEWKNQRRVFRVDYG